MIDAELEHRTVPHKLIFKFDDDLKTLAVKHCIESNGIDDWNTMHFGDQDAQINSFIDGYKCCVGTIKSEPCFVIGNDLWGKSC